MAASYTTTRDTTGWQPQNRYMQTKAMAELTPPTIDAVPTEIETIAA